MASLILVYERKCRVMALVENVAVKMSPSKCRGQKYPATIISPDKNVVARGATRNLSWGCSTFWGKAHPLLVSSALHSPPYSCTRCFPTTLNMSSLPPTHLKAGGLGFSPVIFLIF